MLYTYGFILMSKPSTGYTYTYRHTSMVVCTAVVVYFIPMVIYPFGVYAKYGCGPTVGTW